jgi:hypothetical protein
MTMNGFVGMMTVAILLGWAQDGFDRQGAGSWHTAPSISLLR